MTTLEATAPETTAVEQPTQSGIFKVGIAQGRTDLLPEFSGLERCNAGCNTPSAALFIYSAENEAAIGLCGHHYRKNRSVLDAAGLYALIVKEGEESLATLKGERAGYLNT